MSKVKGFLQSVLEKTDWKEIYKEHYGILNIEEERIEEEPAMNFEVFYKKKNFPIEVEGEFYSNTKEASELLGINYHTLRDWVNRRRTPKVKCKKLPS